MNGLVMGMNVKDDRDALLEGAIMVPGGEVGFKHSVVENLLWTIPPHPRCVCRGSGSSCP